MTSAANIAFQLHSSINEVREAIHEMDSPFTTHAFIQAFSHRNEPMYLGFLARYQRAQGVRAVNSQIGRFLSIKSNELGIQKVVRTRDSNFFGKNTRNQLWERRS